MKEAKKRNPHITLIGWISIHIIFPLQYEFRVEVKLFMTIYPWYNL